MDEPGRFILYSRAGCHLCEQMQDAIALLPAAAGHPLEVRDVDAEPVTRARYGHKIPVLLYEGVLVCHGRLDADEVHKALARGR